MVVNWRAVADKQGLKYLGEEDDYAVKATSVFEKCSCTVHSPWLQCLFFWNDQAVASIDLLARVYQLYIIDLLIVTKKFLILPFWELLEPGVLEGKGIPFIRNNFAESLISQATSMCIVHVRPDRVFNVIVFYKVGLYEQTDNFPLDIFILFLFACTNFAHGQLVLLAFSDVDLNQLHDIWADPSFKDDFFWILEAVNTLIKRNSVDLLIRYVF